MSCGISKLVVFFLALTIINAFGVQKHKSLEKRSSSSSSSSSGRNLCSSQPCQNGGSCVNQRNSFSCECLVGYTGHVCENVPIRVIGGDYYGRLEVFLRGEWGTVCDDNFRQIEAVVACRQLGLPFSNAIALLRGQLGPGTGPIWLDNTNCVGDETDITDCPSDELPGEGNCSHEEDVGVVCLGDVPDDTVRVRLVDGPSDLEGRLEVFYGGLWGSVCNDEFTVNAAKVVCRMLGVTDVSNAIAVSFTYPSGNGIIWLSDVNCVGNEASITDCMFGPWGGTDCLPAEDIGVKCQ